MLPDLPHVEAGLGVGDAGVGVGRVREDNDGHPNWRLRQTNWALRRLIDMRRDQRSLLVSRGGPGTFEDINQNLPEELNANLL